jgi:hypothetical protein
MFGAVKRDGGNQDRAQSAHRKLALPSDVSINKSNKTLSMVVASNSIPAGMRARMLSNKHSSIWPWMGLKEEDRSPRFSAPCPAIYSSSGVNPQDKGKFLEALS